MGFDLLNGAIVDERSDQRVALEAIADFHLRNHFCKALGETIVDAALNEDSVRAHASLSCIPIFRSDRALDGDLDVRVIEYDERRIAAELERELLERRGALRHQCLSDGRRTREAQFAYERVARERAADRLRIAGDDGDDASRHAGTLGEHAHRERRERREFRGLDDHRAAGCESRRYLARDHRRRKIPRRNSRAHADRLLEHDDALVWTVPRNDISVGALGFLAEPFEERRRIGNLAAALRQGLAFLDRHEHREVLLVRHHQIEPLAQDLRPLLRSARTPVGQCLVSRFDRALRLERA